jgi:protein TonB
MKRKFDSTVFPGITGAAGFVVLLLLCASSAAAAPATGVSRPASSASYERTASDVEIKQPKKQPAEKPVPQKKRDERPSPSPTPAPSADPVPPSGGGDAPAGPGRNPRNAFIDRLQSKQFYPPRARERGIEGKVSLRVSLDSQGRSKSVRIIESSGSSILDQAALDLVGDALPFEPGGNVTMDISIGYKLTD